jgi:hypothetical protein
MYYRGGGRVNIIMTIIYRPPAPVPQHSALFRPGVKMGPFADKMKGKDRSIILRSIDFIKVYMANDSDHTEAQIAENMTFLCVFCPLNPSK